MKRHVEQPEPVRLFIDETLSGNILVNGLRGASVPVTGFSELLKRGKTDAQVLDMLAGQPELYLLTRDRDFRYHAETTKRLMASGIGAFVITSAGNKTAPQLLQIVLTAWPAIQKYAFSHKRPFIAKISTDGRVTPHS